MNREQIIFECKCAKLWIKELPALIRAGKGSPEAIALPIETAVHILDQIIASQPLEPSNAIQY